MNKFRKNEVGPLESDHLSLSWRCIVAFTIGGAIGGVIGPVVFVAILFSPSLLIGLVTGAADVSAWFVELVSGLMLIFGPAGAIVGATMGLPLGLAFARWIERYGMPNHLRLSAGVLTAFMGPIAGVLTFSAAIVLNSAKPVIVGWTDLVSWGLAVPFGVVIFGPAGIVSGLIGGLIAGGLLRGPLSGSPDNEPDEPCGFLLTPAHLDWFGDRSRDADWLARWRDAEPSFVPGTTPEHNMATDHYEAVIVPNTDAGGFACAADRLMRYRFYPPAVSHAIGDHDIAGRAVQPGDRILQRAHLLALGRRPILDVLMMIAIHATVDEPRCKGLTYVTTARHAGVGVWRMEVIWRADGVLVLSMGGVARPAYGRLTRTWPIADFHRHLMRAFQHRAHQLGVEAFRREVLKDMGAGGRQFQEEVT